MKITVLMEDTAGRGGVDAEHGLSLYIETDCHRVLMDTGASEKTLENARVLGADLNAVDTVVISHGHYDHAGGAPAFSKINANAAVYMQQAAGEQFYHGERYIGIDRQLLTLPGVHLLNGDLAVDDTLELFSGIRGRRLWPRGNAELTVLKNGIQMQDEFDHEQVLVVKEGNRNVVFSGCAHNGILNILDRYREIYGSEPYAVVSGFHMTKKTDYTQEDIDGFRAAAEEMSRTGTLFFTGHCTGQYAFNILKEIMKDRLEYIRAGDVFEL